MYVSVTGFVPKGMLQLPRFWWHTARCLAQAKSSAGNLLVTAKLLDGVYHTMTVWTDESSMRAYVKTAAHRRAMSNFRTWEADGLTAFRRIDRSPGMRHTPYGSASRKKFKTEAFRMVGVTIFSALTR